MTAFADGFVAYHIEVDVGDRQASATATTVKGWQSAFRTQGTWPEFPRSMVDELKKLNGVTNVICEGPQSSLLIPLRMVKGITGATCDFSTVLGTGAVTGAIEACLGQWGIATTGVRRLADADAPIEISIREPSGQHETVRLYPASRSRYRSKLQQPNTLPAQFLCNRFNKGVSTLASAVAENAGLVSFRPRELGRHDRIEDYVSLLASTQHLVLSSRHRMIRQFARQAGVETPGGWPSTLEELSDPSAVALVRWLWAQMPQGAIVVLVGYRGSEAAFFRDRLEPILVSAPQGYGPESRAARIQGALLGEVMQASDDRDPCGDQTSWDAACRSIVAAAFKGTESRPWRYQWLVGEGR